MTRCDRVAGLAVALMVASTATTAQGALIINEVHFDPAANIDHRGDANGDGAAHYKEDEFVEILNTGPTTVNIGGYRIGDNDRAWGDLFAFPGGTTIVVNELVTLFGGGTPTGFTNQVFTDDGSIGSGLGNDNENVFLISADQADTVEIYWGSAVPYNSADAVQISGAESDPNESYTRDPDGGGSWAKHSVADTDDNSLFSPGARISGEANLPVRLAYFRGVPTYGGVHLQWRTVSEDGASHFEIYRADNPAMESKDLVDVVPAAPGGYSARPIDYAIEDLGLEESKRYWYSLDEIDLDSSKQSFGLLDVVTLAASQDLPGGRFVELAQNSPNPFNPRTEIEFTLAEPTPVNLSIYDLAGNKIHELVSGERSPGTHRVTWDGQDARGMTVSSGVYLYRIETNQGAEARRMILVK